MKYAIVGLVLMLLMAACGTETPTPTPQPEATQAPAPTVAPPTATAMPAATPQPVATQTPVPAATPSAISLTDSTGEVLTFETRPVRAACLTEICADIMAELRLEPVAVNDPLSSDPRFFGSRADEFRIIGGSFFEPNLEDIAAAQPDIVFGLGGVHDGLRDALRPIAPLYIVNPVTYEDSIQYLRDIGAATGRSAEAEEAVQRFLDKLEDYKARSPKDRSALVMFGSDVNFGIDTEDALTGGLLAEVTGYPWPSQPTEQGGHGPGSTQYSLEGVLSVDPDVIFVQTLSFPGFQPPPLQEQMAANPLWGELKAVKNGEVHPVSFSLWSTGRGTRSLGLVLDEAMPLLYPDVFGKSASTMETPSAISLTDSTGEVLTFATRPARAACLTEICADIMAELGLEPVAVNDPLSSDPRFFGSRADEFRIIGGSFFEPNLEDIAAAQPDIVFGLGGVHDGLRDALRPIAPLYIVNPVTYEDSIQYLRDIGAATGRSAEAEEAVQRFLDKLEDYKARSPKDRTALVMFGSDVNFGIDTEDALTGGLLAEVTAYPWPSQPTEQGGHGPGSTQYSLEGVLSVDPDVIFVQTLSFPGFQPPPLQEQMAANPLWGELKAVKNGEVHPVSFSLWSTGRGTRSLGLVLDEAMPLLYPDVFGK